MSGTRSRAIWVQLLLLAALLTGVLTACESRAAEIGMQIEGHVTTINGDLCQFCKLVLVGQGNDIVKETQTDGSGHFRFVHLPAGTYGFLVHSTDGSLEVSRTTYLNTPLRRNAIAVAVVDGENVTGVELIAPPPEGVASTLGIAPSAGAATTPPSPSPEEAPSAVPRFCGDGFHEERYRGVQVFVTQRGPDERLPDTETRCDSHHAIAAGCTLPAAKAEPQPPARDLPVCDDTGRLALPRVVFMTRVFIHQPTWTGFDPEPPDREGCAAIVDGECEGYFTFRGTIVHECTHAIEAESLAIAGFRQYLETIRSIQERIDRDGGCHQCCLFHLHAAIDAHRAVLAEMQKEPKHGKGSEESAREATCRYYKERYETACRTQFPRTTSW